MAEEGNIPQVPKPGFFHLDLFVKDTKDVSPWYDELKTRLAQETGPMESAMTNLLSVFAFYKLRGQGEARKLLEGLTRRDENNLNAIANKQFIYGQLMRAKDEMACRDRLQDLLADQSHAARARNARCFAEQGYALAFDVRDDSKDMVSKMKSAISLFERALTLAGNADTMAIEERLVWKFYLSKCYWRLEQVVGGVQRKAAALTPADMLRDFTVIRDLLLEVTKLDPSWEHGRFYLARAWALLGALESKCREKLGNAYKTPKYLLKEIHQTKESQIGPQFGCFKRAVEINPSDSEVYRRFGQMYLREKMYKKARQMLNKSIEIMPTVASNWVAYYIRSLVNTKQYDELTKEGSVPSKQLLNTAKADAIACCEGAATQFNICHLGKVCHRLAIHPFTRYVENWEELEDALDHFALALQLEDGFTNPEIQAARGWCLEDAGEHEKAAESYKRAVENDADNTSYVWNLGGVLRNLLSLHGKYHMEHYIAEIAFWIKEGYKKYKDIKPAFRQCVFKEGQMTQVCQYLMEFGDSQLARVCLKGLQRHKNRKCRTEAKLMLSKLPNKAAFGIDGPSSAQCEQETTVHSKVPMTIDTPRHGQGQEFQYDFFVSHSSKDADWVNYALLPALEGDLRFKGCVADRDFLPGKSVFDNIIDSIENSYKTLLILTPDFVNSVWCKYETEQALMESLRGKTGRVIPIMLKECVVPSSVRTITYLDVSRDAIGSYDWLKLKKALEQTPSTETD